LQEEAPLPLPIRLIGCGGLLALLFGALDSQGLRTAFHFS